MSLSTALLVAAIAIGVPLLTVLAVWFPFRAHSRAGDPRTGIPEKSGVGAASWYAIVVCYAALGAFLAFRALLGRSWFGGAIALFLSMQAVYLYLRFRNSQLENEYPLALAPVQWRTLATGTSAATVLALLGGMSGDGLGSFVWAFLMAWLTILLIAASRRTSPPDW